MFGIGMAVFTLASLLGGLAHSGLWLVGAGARQVAPPEDAPWAWRRVGSPPTSAVTPVRG
jgi:hypothetical protein